MTMPFIYTPSIFFVKTLYQWPSELGLPGVLLKPSNGNHLSCKYLLSRLWGFSLYNTDMNISNSPLILQMFYMLRK